MKRLLLLLLPACNGGADAVLTVTGPTGEAEVVPAGSVDVTWTLTGGGGHLAVDGSAIATGNTIHLFDQEVPEGDGLFHQNGVDLDGEPIAPDVYDLVFFLDGAEVDPIASLLFNGIIVTDPAAGEVATATGTYDLQLTTVTQRPLQLTTKLGDLEIDDQQINGELVPHGRTISFDGMDTSGTPVPAGDYTVTVIASDPSSNLIYAVEGGTLSFTP